MKNSRNTSAPLEMLNSTEQVDLCWARKRQAAAQRSIDEKRKRAKRRRKNGHCCALCCWVLRDGLRSRDVIDDVWGKSAREKSSREAEAAATRTFFFFDFFCRFCHSLLLLSSSFVMVDRSGRINAGGNLSLISFCPIVRSTVRLLACLFFRGNYEAPLMCEKDELSAGDSLSATLFAVIVNFIHVASPTLLSTETRSHVGDEFKNQFLFHTLFF